MVQCNTYTSCKHHPKRACSTDNVSPPSGKQHVHIAVIETCYCGLQLLWATAAAGALVLGFTSCV